MEDSSTARLTPTAPEPDHMVTENIYAELMPARAPPSFSATANSNPDTRQLTGRPSAAAPAVPVELPHRTQSDLSHLYPNLVPLPEESQPGLRMYAPHRVPMPPYYPIPMPRTTAAAGNPPTSSAGFHVEPQVMQKAVLDGDHHSEATVLLWYPRPRPSHEAATPVAQATLLSSQKKLVVPAASTTASVLSGSASASTVRLGSRARKGRVPDPSLACFCFISFLIFVVGCATLVLGAMAFFGEERLAALIQTDSSGNLQAFNVLGLLRSSSVFLVVVGAAVLFLGFLGCCGVMMNSKAMVAAFGLLVLLLIVTQVTLGLLTWVYRDAARDNLKQALVTSIKLNYDGQVNTSNAISQAIDFVQVTLGCCGVQGAGDFNDTPWDRQHPPHADFTVPRTCCRLRDDSDHQQHLQQQPQQQPPKREPHQQQQQNQHQTFSSSSSSSSLSSSTSSPSLALPGSLELANESCPYTAPGPANPNTDISCLEVVQEMVTKYLAVLLTLGVALVLVEMASACSACNVLTTLQAKERHAKAQRRAAKRHRL